MKTIKITLFILLILLFYNHSSAQFMNQPGTILISTNPLKLIYGLVNIEIEYMIAPSASVKINSEYLLSEWVIKKEKHPVSVTNIGVRYHFLQNKKVGNNNDLYIGLNSGYSWSKNYSEHTSFLLGLDAGYKYQFNSELFINAKGLLTYPVKNHKILPGFECLFGYTFLK